MSVSQLANNMSADTNSKVKQFFSGWGLVAALLAVIIIAGAVFIGVSRGSSRGLEISITTQNDSVGQINVSGEVVNPGIYPLKAGDTIADVLKAAGGVSANADADYLTLGVGSQGETKAPQKVDINRAGAWLLAALPGIGDTRAQAIVQYREKNGPFRDIYELQKVAGIGDVTFNNIKGLITVGGE